jgi:hypothetical protein
VKALLLGAGFSYDLGMPIAKELTDVFLDLFNEKNTVDQRAIERSAIWAYEADNQRSNCRVLRAAALI